MKRKSKQEVSRFNKIECEKGRSVIVYFQPLILPRAITKLDMVTLVYYYLL